MSEEIQGEVDAILFHNINYDDSRRNEAEGIFLNFTRINEVLPEYSLAPRKVFSGVEVKSSSGGHASTSLYLIDTA